MPDEITPAGKVCTGFSKPWVAKYVNGGGGNVSYTGAMRLARGVDVDLDVESSDDNNFYADNALAESAGGVFQSGTLNLTVDGLLIAAEKMISGLPDPTKVTVGQNQVDIYDYGDDMRVPYCGVGFIARYMSGGVVTWTPYVLTKVKFAPVPTAAATQGEDIDWQTQALTGAIHRDDTAKHNWKRVGEDQTSEEAAEDVIKALLGAGA